MPRTKSTTKLEIVETPLPVERIEADNNRMAAHAEQVLAKFGDGLPYQRLRYVDKCRYHMARSAEEALEVGRCLIVMKEHEPHGEFLDCLSELGLAPRLAQRMMQATLKFANASTSTHLLAAAKTKSKLFELMVLDDEDLKELSEGGTVAGLTLDEVDRMSVSELRAALRKARQEAQEQEETYEQLLAKKDSKINSLDKELAKRSSITPDQREAERQQIESELLTRLKDVSLEFIAHVQGFSQAVADCLHNSPSTSTETAVVSTVQWVFQRIDEIAKAHTIPVDFAEHVTPSWMADLMQNAKGTAQEG